MFHVNYSINYHESIGLPPQAMHRTQTLASDLMPGRKIELANIWQGPYVVLMDCKPWFDGGFPDLQVVNANRTRTTIPSPASASASTSGMSSRNYKDLAHYG